MSEDISQVQENVDKALSKGTFSLREALNGRSYPTSKVIVYLDVENIVKLSKVNDRLTEIAQDPAQDQEEYDKYDRLKVRLQEKILASGVTFHLRGISPAEITRLSEKAAEWAKEQDVAEDSGKAQTYYMNSLLAAHIVKTENAEGEIDERRYTLEDVEALEDLLPGEQFNALVSGFTSLSFESAYYTQAVDAGFLPTS